MENIINSSVTVPMIFNHMGERSLKITKLKRFLTFKLLLYFWLKQTLIKS